MENRRLIIIDDHGLFANSLAMMVSNLTDFKISKIFKNGLEFINYVKDNQMQTEADIILLDINMPIMNGLETMSWMKKFIPEQKVIALSVNDDEKVVTKMVKLGVKGYLLKDCEPIHFKEALEVVKNNGLFYSDKISKYIIESIYKSKSNVFSEKESEFITYACTELTYKEIAEKMHCSPKTIDNYRESVFDKLSVKTRIGIVLYAIKHKLV